MRGVETRIQEIRHRIFREVARMAYHTEWQVDKRIEELPYKIIPGEIGNFRNDIFLERAIVGERLRLAMGLPNRSAAEHAPLSDNIEAADRPETYYTPPLINIIKFACNGCAEKRVIVTEGCQGCLAHPCEEVCPKDAIKLDRYNGRSHIDQAKCIKCGRCATACSYNAIIVQERPCAAACGMNAIHSDENGKADIDYEKCVSCGQCLVNCPFGAISDKSQIFQTIRAIQSGERVYAAVAPAFVGQFGPKVTPGKLRAAMKQLGFYDVVEVALGADLCATQEAEDFLAEVPEKLPFMATSCCPAWSMMAKKLYPDHANCISMALTPMTLTARYIKKNDPDAKVVFIGPCAAKKLEAMRRTVRSEVDFVLTFEEMAGIFDAKHVDLESTAEDPNGVDNVSTDGRNFAVAGGVAQSVVDVIKSRYPDREVKVANAESLQDCRKLLAAAVAGKYNGYLLEGMACPGGCIAGAGTMQPITKSKVAVNMYAKQANHVNCNETEQVKDLDKLIY
ncbi:MAG: 4Fe-4S dicluster domain-containing protein [Lachnospiraceae bacterium]|nr:4Fe-4S dicluster domain-containing protein [Lachnospiraceae bacterium]